MSPVEGVRIHISHTDTHEVMSLSCDVDLDSPAHAHSAQWTVVLRGRIDHLIDGRTTTCTAGDRSDIPAGVEHTVFIRAGSIEVFLVVEPDLLALAAAG